MGNYMQTEESFSRLIYSHAIKTASGTTIRRVYHRMLTLSALLVELDVILLE